MRFQIIASALALAATAIAVPTTSGSGSGGDGNGNTVDSGNSATQVQNDPSSVSDISVQDAARTCGNQNLTLQCCNSISQTGDAVNEASGVLSGLIGDSLDGVGLFNGCSGVDVTAIIGIDQLLNSKCKANVACCQGDNKSGDGLVNVGLPCIALSGLL